jgi:hypothetical protein
MTDFCIETTAIHDEYIHEYNKNFEGLIDKLPNTQFFLITTNPELAIKKPNLKVVDVSLYMGLGEKFTKSYDHKTGFCKILQSTRYGLYEACLYGYTKVIHLQTDMSYSDEITEENLSNHFKLGVYFDMGGETVGDKLQGNHAKTKYLAEYAEHYPIDNLTVNDIPTGDDPVVFLMFETTTKFVRYLSKLSMLCYKTAQYPEFTTGIADELTFAMHLIGVKSRIREPADAKYFDVNHAHLHNKHYVDKNPDNIR